MRPSPKREGEALRRRGLRQVAATQRTPAARLPEWEPAALS